MKKLTIILCLILPLCALAQDFKTLVHQADSLNKKSKHKKALALYDKAIERVITYKDMIDNHQWFYVCTKAAELSGNDYAKYAPARYFADGEKFKEKISDLKKQESNCIFTYNTYGLGSARSSYIVDTTKKFQFIPSDNKKLLIWVIDNAVYMQAYGDNVYKPVKINNPQLLDFLNLYHNQLRFEEPGRQYPKMNHRTIFIFGFYWAGSVYRKTIDEPENLHDPNQNANTYLGKLLPMVQAEADNYYYKVF